MSRSLQLPVQLISGTTVHVAKLGLFCSCGATPPPVILVAMTGPVARQLADELRTAEVERFGIPLPTDRFADFSWADARAVARERDALRLADGDTPIGYKLGWTSAAMRAALGIDRPNWGTLWASQRLEERVSLDQLIHPKVEPEIVFVAGSVLSGTVSIADVLDAAAGWAIGLEVVDPRFPSFEFRWLDNTADNSSAAGIRTGEVSRQAGGPAEWRIEMSDGHETRSGTGAEAMGSPASAVAWLVERLAEEGAKLREGEIVYTGGLAAPFDLQAGRSYTVTGSGTGDRFGAVSFAVDPV